MKSQRLVAYLLGLFATGVGTTIAAVMASAWAEWFGIPIAERVTQFVALCGLTAAVSGGGAAIVVAVIMALEDRRE